MRYRKTSSMKIVIAPERSLESRARWNFTSRGNEITHWRTGAQGSTRNVAGSGTRITSGNPVISGMSNPPPATNTGVNR